MLQKQEVTLNLVQSLCSVVPRSTIQLKISRGKRNVDNFIAMKISPQMSQTSLDHIFFFFLTNKSKFHLIGSRGITLLCT